MYNCSTLIGKYSSTYIQNYKYSSSFMYNIYIILQLGMVVGIRLKGNHIYKYFTYNKRSDCEVWGDIWSSYSLAGQLCFLKSSCLPRMHFISISIIVTAGPGIVRKGTDAVIFSIVVDTHTSWPNKQLRKNLVDLQ